MCVGGGCLLHYYYYINFYTSLQFTIHKTDGLVELVGNLGANQGE